MSNLLEQFLQFIKASGTETQCDSVVNSAARYLAARCIHVQLRHKLAPRDEIETADRIRTSAHNSYIDALRIASRTTVQRSKSPLPVGLLPLIGDPADSRYRQRVAEEALAFAIHHLETEPKSTAFDDILTCLPGDQAPTHRLTAAKEMILAC